jgi:hypothetical protein
MFYPLLKITGNVFAICSYLGTPSVCPELTDRTRDQDDLAIEEPTRPSAFPASQPHSEMIRVSDPVLIEFGSRDSGSMSVGEQDICPFMAPVVDIRIDRDAVLIYVIVATPSRA